MKKPLSTDFLKFLHSNHLLTDDEFISVQKELQTKTEKCVSEILKMDLLNEEEIIPLIAGELDIKYINLKKTTLDTALILSIPAKFAYHYHFIPVDQNDNILKIAFTSPEDIELIDEIQTVLEKKIRVLLAGKKDIRDALKKYYGIGADTVQQMIDQSEDSLLDLTDTAEMDIENLSEDASIIKFVNQVISEAVKERATDIHIEPYENELKIRYRIDGILYDAPFPTTIKHFHHPIISRFKIMSNLNISERRIPQDGRLKVKLKNKELDLRLSILPTPWGEAASIRILSGASDFLEMKDLGLEESELSRIQSSISKPHGMILVTGPTGSGKTTSLYACLNRLNTRDRKIITIEDPIEYLIPNITQLQVNPAIHFSFATGLRSMLRHDPDVMMVGEIRDFETAEISVQAALTGHLVFSTVHTNDAPGTIIRMTDIGIEHFLLASCLQCVIAQRLVRVLCPECKTLEHLPLELLNSLPDLPQDFIESYRAVGCNRCNFTGFYGRTAIFEIMSINQNLRDMIQKKASIEDIRKEAFQTGTKTLRQSGYDKVKEGITSLEEVLRVTSDHY